MEITEVKVTPINNVKKLKGFASIVLDNCFIVSDIKIIETINSAFLSMPSKRSKNGKFRDVAHPLNMETRKLIEEKVFEEYEKLTGEKIEGEATLGYNHSLSEEESQEVEDSYNEKTNEELDSSEATQSDILSVKEFGY